MKFTRKFCLFYISFLIAHVNAEEENTEIPTVQGSMTVTSLRLASEGSHPSFIIFGKGEKEYKVGIDSNGDFSISSDRSSMLTINQKDEIIVAAENFRTKYLDVEGDFRVSGIPQFRVVVREDFSKGVAPGWDNKAEKEIVSNCGGIFMLGGFGKFAKGEVTKKYEKLPPHSFLKIEATYHFIDAWVGETGFMRVNNGEDDNFQYVWTDRHSQDMEQDSVNVCGNSVGEGKFATPINIIIPHNKDSVIIGFGSTMTTDDPTDESWGVSGIQLSII